MPCPWVNTAQWMSQALTMPIAPPPLWKREGVSAHSTAALFPCGEEHESPSSLLQRQKWWKRSLHSDSETWFKWETVTKSGFLRSRIVVPISKCVLFKWLFKKKLSIEHQLQRLRGKSRSTRPKGSWWRISCSTKRRSWTASCFLAPDHQNTAEDLVLYWKDNCQIKKKIWGKIQGLPGTTNQTSAYLGGRETSNFQSKCRKIHEVLFRSGIC